MEWSSIVDRLEDLTVRRDYRLARWVERQGLLHLREMYDRWGGDLVHVETVLGAKADLIHAFPRSIPIADIQSLKWLQWIYLESATVDQLESVLEGCIPSGPGQELGNLVIGLLDSRDRSLAKLLVDGLDPINPLRLAWRQAWHRALRELGWLDGGTWTESWQGWSWDALLRRRDTYLVDVQPSLPTPVAWGTSDWLDLIPGRNIMEAIQAAFPVSPCRLVTALWKDILGLTLDLNADFRWIHATTEVSPRFGPSLFFDGGTLRLFTAPEESWWSPFCHLYLWGAAQPALWTGIDYSWSRLYGGDPAIPVGWGLWLARWPTRPSFWEAVEQPIESMDLLEPLHRIDATVGAWIATAAPWAVQSAGLSPDRIAPFLEHCRSEIRSVLHWKVEPEWVVPWAVNRGSMVNLFRGWIFSTAIHLFLEDLYGLRWWTRKPAMFFLTDLWESGTDLFTEDILKDIGYRDRPTV